MRFLRSGIPPKRAVSGFLPSRSTETVRQALSGPDEAAHGNEDTQRHGDSADEPHQHDTTATAPPTQITTTPAPLSGYDGR